MRGRAYRVSRKLDCTQTQSHANTLGILLLALPSALEHFKRWLIPEKVAISAEELEYLLRPSQHNEPVEENQRQNQEETEGDGEGHNPEEEDVHNLEK